MKNIIFDFDGTIANSLPVIIPFANSALTKFNRDKITVEELNTLGVKQAIRSRHIPKYALFLYLLIGRKNLESHIASVKVFDGIKEVVKQLAPDHTLGIVTSSSELAVRKLLTKHKLVDHFEFIKGSFGLFGKDEKINKVCKKLSLNKKETIYIGDETRDIEAAKSAKVTSGAVTWGFEGEALLKKANPDFIFRKPQDLLKIK
jgi:HAD superfamily hydrolase (TIGR01549 family)